MAVGLFLVWIFSNLPRSAPPQASKARPAVIAPVSAPAPKRSAPPMSVPIAAPAPQPKALQADAPVREFWTWNYAEGVTGLSKAGLQSLQEVALALRENPRLTARVQVGATSTTGRAGAMAAERASLVARTLQEQGVAPNQVIIDAQGNGEPRQGSVTLESR
jgi:outer membrane protein OmpA-like peptidoglycan-associated protein